MKDANLSLFQKGTFKPINNKFMLEGMEVLQRVTKVQKKYINECVAVKVSNSYEGIVISEVI